MYSSFISDTCVDQIIIVWFCYNYSTDFEKGDRNSPSPQKENCKNDKYKEENDAKGRADTDSHTIPLLFTLKLV